ncbi:hypothetical protein VOLCADRAFT_90840 [Volvox carteri f. nagariensis]|uniref:1,3-beta-glucan synthase component FKS1-like domain-containing protein n=1 Tax=Volvox carteri f. nagariensis TaxID=3068 RepID=D8TV72_VOLCA|nr:uncharacterized protein VOLCADRAFT_90840 [Volvox carteri f. nagariensis]EFJ48653.1 hypothetical protein VOLCADRAFT_90840 [Volvox carteri f. nagariensis]|eukprot:XP_002950452.1 hypothetical protein VOLCADRAFT_90840 [Volvox carteri f. nagariensis]
MMARHRAAWPGPGVRRYLRTVRHGKPRRLALRKPQQLTRRAASGAELDQPGTAGPSIVAGRLTASGITTSARQLAPHLGALSQPHRLRESAPGALSAQSQPTPVAAPAPQADPAAANAQEVSRSESFLARHLMADEEPGEGTQTEAPAARLGWRSAVGAISHGAEHGSSKELAEVVTAAAAPSQSLWRSITKSFAGRLQPEDDNNTPRTSDSGRPEKTGRTATTPLLSFRAPASLLPDSESPADGAAATEPPGTLQRTPGNPDALPSSSGADDPPSLASRVEAAATRAVHEADAEAAATAAGAAETALESERSGALSDGTEPGGRKGSNRRLRFISENVGSQHSSTGASPSSLHRTRSAATRGQSFRERVANALGLGALIEGSRSRDDEESTGSSPSAIAQRSAAVHSALKKEGTSKQLRLGFAAEEDDSDSDGEPGGGAGGKVARGSSYREQRDGAAAVTPFMATGMDLASLHGRPDSAVVPGRLHISAAAGQLDAKVHDLEGTLLSPSELLPPGESLPPPLPRQGGLLAKSATDRSLAAVAGSKAVAATAPVGVTMTESSQRRLEALRALSVKSAAVAAAASTAADTAVGSFGGSVATVAATSVAASLVPPTTAAAASEASGGQAAGPPDVSRTASATVKARSTIKLPIITTGHWDNLVFATVWRVGRVFGFQAFNMRPATQDDAKHEYVPASIFVAADHLNQLLVKNGYVRRHRGDDSDEERFAKALFEFHSTIFYSYEMQWIKMQRLSPRAQRFTDELRERVFSDHHVINGLLCELALYFLIYTEAANVRFCPEAMWMIFWCMNHSYVMADLWNRGSPDRVPNSRDRLPQLRNTFQHLIKDLQVQISIRPADMRPEDCGKMSSILSRLSTTSDVPLSDRELLADLVCYGDGGFFMDRIITPIFFVMSYEIDHLSTLGVDTAHRLGYDDFNESLTCRDVVYSALLELRVTPQDIAAGATNDAYQSLTSLGFQGRTVINNKFDPQVAAEWWRLRVFVKTYRERRSWLGIYRAFYRVYAFHFVLFHLMQAQAFAGWNWRVVSSAILTHAWLKWLERVANWMMTMPSPEPLQTTMTKIFDRKGFYKLDQILGLQAQSQKSQRYRGGVAAHNNADRLKLMKAHQTQSANDIASPLQQMSIRQLKALQPERILEIEGAPMYGLFGGLTEWLVIAISLTALYTLQFINIDLRPYAYDNWGYVAAGYTGLHVLHFLLTTRDGYAISLSEALGLPEYFQNWSSRPRPRTWMYADMHIKWKNFFVNVFFWLLVFALKIPFDYFVIHQPLVKPLRLLLKRNWMGCKGSSYRFGHVRIHCIGADWILVAARVFPFIIVALFDTALFYQFVVTAFGIYHGLIKLDLGVVSTWEDLVREFHKSPPRWWIRCMSFTGNENQKNLLYQTISANAQAAANADTTGGAEGGDGKKNVAISDGLMFKIKIVTPEEIKAKQNLMLKERKINMHAGKGAISNEVEVKTVKAVQDKAGTTATGTTTGTANRPSAATLAPNTAVNGRNGVPLVGQDFKDAQSRPQGLGGLFGWRGSNGGEAPGGPTPGMVQLPGVVPLPGARSGAGVGGGSSSTAPTAVSRFGTRDAGSQPGASGGAAGMIAGKMKSLGTAGIAASILTRKANQVQPEPVAEAVEERQSGSQLTAAAAAAASASSRFASGAAQGPGILPGCGSGFRPRTARSRALLQRPEGPTTWSAVRHPAWQPEALLGPGHADYDPAMDPMSPGNVQREGAGRGGGSMAAVVRRFWSRRQGTALGEDAAAGGEAGGLVSGPALASLRVHGWRPESEIEAALDKPGMQLQEEEEEEGEEEEGPQRQRQQAVPEFCVGGMASSSSRVVYRGAVGEGVTLVGPGGKPLPEEATGEDYGSRGGQAAERRSAPVVLLSEVPIIRVDSEGSDDVPSRQESLDRPTGAPPSSLSKDARKSPGAGAGGELPRRRSIEFKEVDADTYHEEASRGGRAAAGGVKFTARRVSLMDLGDDNGSPGGSKTGKNKAAKASPS